LNAVVEEIQEIVGNYPFERIAVGIAQADPETVEFGAAEEGFAFRFEVSFKLANEVDGANTRKGNFLVLAVGG